MIETLKSQNEDLLTQWKAAVSEKKVLERQLHMFESEMRDGDFG